jgi:pyruvate, water dikinase
VKKTLQDYDLLNTNTIHSAEKVREALTKLKEIYAHAKVPDSIIAVFKKAIMEDVNSPVHISKLARLRLRSSTNSEDLDGFTGAGLYDSDGFNLYKKKDDGTYDRSKPRTWEKIEADIREILPALYSSVWNERAFQEREWYQMNGEQHLMIKVGLAFHGAFPLMGFDGLAEVANGVAVTTNIYNPADWGKVYINAQHFDLSVTNPPLKKELLDLGETDDKPYRTSEILVTSFTADDTLNTNPNNWTKWPVENLASSSVKNGADVLQGQETLKLARAFWMLNKEMAKVYKKKPDQFSIDIEWKIYGPERQLIIKQARPFVPPAAH